MIAFLTFIHVLICIIVIISVLLQSSKGGGLAGMFGGGGGMGNVFGGRGAATFLSRITTWAGLSLALTSLIIALLTSGTSSRQRSLIEQEIEQQEVQSTPATMLPAIDMDVTDDTAGQEEGNE